MADAQRGTLVVTAFATSANLDEVLATCRNLLAHQGRPDAGTVVLFPPFVLVDDIAATSAPAVVRELRSIGVQAEFQAHPEPKSPHRVKRKGSGKPPRPRPSALRWVLPVLALLLIVAYGLLTTPWPREKGRALLQETTSALTGDSGPAVLAVPAKEMRQAFDDQFALFPDRRMVGAFEVLTQAAARWGGEADADVELAMGTPVNKGDALVIPLAKNGDAVGDVRLPLPGTVAATVEALTQWTALLAQHGRPIAVNEQGIAAATLSKAEQHIHAMAPLLMLKTLELMETHRREAGMDAQMTRLAARGYAILTLTIGEDWGGNAGKCAEHALVFLAITRHLDPSLPIAAEQCLLAAAMGYGNDADTLANDIVSNDPTGFDAQVAAFARQDLPTLRTMQQDTTPLASSFLIQTLLQQRQNHEAKPLLTAILKGDQAPAHMLTLASRYLSLTPSRRISQHYPAYVLDLLHLHMGHEAKDHNTAIPLTQLQQTLDGWRPEDTAPGVFMDVPRQRAVMAAMYTNAVASRFHVLANRVSSMGSATSFLETLGDQQTDHPLLKTWRADILAETGKRQEAEALAEELLNQPDLPPALAYWAYSLINTRKGKIRLAPLAASHLDASPHGRHDLGKVFHHMTNYDLAEQAYASAIALNGRDLGVIWNLAQVRKDDTPYDAALARAPGNPGLLREAAAYYKKPDTTEGHQKALECYNKALQHTPDDTRLLRDKAYSLIRTGKPGEAIAILEQLIKDSPARDLTLVGFQSRLAIAYLEKDQPQKAVEIIEPAAASYQAGAMMTAVDAYEAAGQQDMAQTWLERATERYPHTEHVLAGAAGYHWRQGDYVKAAEYIRQGRPVFGHYATWYGDTFLKAFADAPKKQILAAVAALVGAEAAPAELKSLGHRLLLADKPDVALPILQMMAAPSANEHLNKLIDIYWAEKALKGEEAAQNTLRGSVSEQAKGRFTMALFHQGLYEFLLTEYPDPTAVDPKHPEFIQLMRVLAWLCLDRTPASYEADFTQYYQRESDNFYHAAGRFCLGMLSQADFLALATSPKRQCEAAYYIGLTHRLQGDFQEAAVWYQICLQTGLSNNGEYHWATRELNNWGWLGTSNRHRFPADDTLALAGKM